jgi:hypothetical protein
MHAAKLSDSPITASAENFKALVAEFEVVEP